jgi:ubiquinol-cytochrome c reductase cytochrome b subunit
LYVLIPLSIETKIKIPSINRIGPHNIDIISLIIGSVLGDSHLEKRTRGLGTRVLFEQSNKNVEYLMWFHQFLGSRGYCSFNKPKLHKRIKKENKIFYHFRINSYTFSSFNWIHELFYKKDNLKNKFIKIVPLNIEEYLTPLALAIWFMDDGSKLGKGVRIATNNFTLREVEFLCLVLFKKFNLIATVHTGGKNKGYVLYIHTKSVPLFISIVKPHMLPSMLYKLGIKI